MSKEEDQIEGFPDFWQLFLLDSVTLFLTSFNLMLPAMLSGVQHWTQKVPE